MTTGATYDPAFFQPLFDAEDRHFWFRSRNRIVRDVVERLLPALPPGAPVLEVGCGTGNVLRVLREACPAATVVGMDLYAEGLAFARRRTPTPLVQGDMHQPPFRSQFGIIGLFDVLEHLPDDRRVLRDLRAMLQPGGYLVLTVPAHPTLWSYFDEASQHQRRYRPDELRRKLDEAGFTVEFMSQYMMSAFVPMWLGRRLAALQRGVAGAPDGKRAEALATRELRPTPVVNDLFMGLLAVERAWLARGRALPLGTSLLAVGQAFQ